MIATPSSLASFSLRRLLRNIKILCVDEADVLLTGCEKQMTWNLLKEMRHHYNNDVKLLHNLSRLTGEISTNYSEAESADHLCGTYVHRQILFTAATLPSCGTKSVQAQLVRWVPKNTLFFTTEHTHQVIHLARLQFVDIKTTEDRVNDSLKTRFDQLIEDLLDVKENVSTIERSCQTEDTRLPKVILFANTVTSAEEIFNHLEQIAAEQTDIWWKGRIGRLHKQSSVNGEEKERTLRDFRSGNCRVLVSTDLASRGLDLPDVTTVIQVDFPGNSADFLHRAGRTARAGKSGTGMIVHICVVVIITPRACAKVNVMGLSICLHVVHRLLSIYQH